MWLLGLCCACDGLKDPDWDTSSQVLQGGSDWRADLDGDGSSADDGSADDSDGDGSADDGSSDDGSADADGSDGSSDDGSSDDGSDDGSSVDGSADDGSGDDGEPDPDPAAGVGGLAQFTYNVNACTECLSSSVATAEVTAKVRFHPPMTASWLSWMPSLGMCVIDPSRASLGSVGLDLGTGAALAASSTMIPLVLDTSTNTYKAEDLPMSTWVNSSPYSLSFSDGDEVENVLYTTGGFDALGPAALLEPTPATAFSAPISMSGATFTWAPAGMDDGLMISIQVYDGSTGSYKGEMLCNAPDAGSYTVPGSAFLFAPSFGYGDSVMVGIWRYRLTYTFSPVDGSIIEGLAQKGATGTGYLSY
jgi:hypothetical protein